MTRPTANLSEQMARYVVEHSTAPDDVQHRLIAATAELGFISLMQIAPDQGAMMSILVGVTRPRFAVEVGTFTGYSSLAIARALPPDGRLLCCDMSEEWTAIAQQHWEEAGVADRIDLRIGPALETVRSLPADQTVDFVFIDADKGSYVDYYEELLPRLSPHGLMTVDNTLWDGNVINPDDTSADTEAIRRFNDHAVADPRTEVALVPIGDGLTLIRRVE